jgi:lysophospholipase L1-like esterase
MRHVLVFLLCASLAAAQTTVIGGATGAAGPTGPTGATGATGPNSASIPGGQVSPNTALLAHFNAATTTQAAQSVVLIGDSETQGWYATNRLSQSWAGLLTSTLQTLYGNRGTGLISTNNTSNYAWTVTGSWTGSTTIGAYQATGPIYSVFSATGTGAAYSASISYSLPAVLADSFTVVSYTASDSGNCAVSIDGGAATVLTHGTSSPAAPVSDTVSAGSLGNHTISIGPNGSTQKCYFMGVIPSRGTTGLQVHNLGISGARTTFNGATTGTAGGMGFLSLLSPDLVIVSLGINDFNDSTAAATVSAQYTTILNAAQTAGASIVILSEAPNSASDGSALWTSYRSALQTLATTYSAAFLDVTTRWVTYTAANAQGFINTNHPSTSGHNDIANYLISSLFPLAAVMAPPVPVAAASGLLSGTPVVFTPNTDLVCASAGDPTIARLAVTGATLAANAVLTVSGTTQFPIGSKVTLSGFADTGWNGTTYTVTANPATTTVAISLNSSGLSFTAAGTPSVSLTCGNAADSTGTVQAAFVTTYPVVANSFLTQGKRLRIETLFKVFAASNTTTTNPTVRFKFGALTAYAPNGGGQPMTASQNGLSLPGRFALTAMGTASASAPLIAEGQILFPGWSFVNAQNGNAPFQLYNLITPNTISIAVGWAVTGAGGTIAYSSGGTATGTGNCLATANGTTSPASNFTATGLIAVSGGVISGNLQIGATLAQTTTGSGYAAIPTTWGLTVPTAGGASTCTGTITTSGGTLVGAMGNALMLVVFTPTWVN